MKEGDDFCGYSCTSEKEEIQKVIDRTVEFSKINPEWGLIMLGKFMEMIYDARLNLSKDMTKWPDEPRLEKFLEEASWRDHS